MDRLQTEKDLVMAGYMALSGSAALVRRAYGRLAERLPEELLWTTQECCRQLTESMGALPECLANLAGAGENVCFALGRGGIFNGLWQMAQKWQVGFSVDLQEIPVRQETIEICECLEINPYYLCSEQSFLIAAEHGNRLCRMLEKQGWPAAVIGTLHNGKDKRLVHGDIVSCLNRPQEDEWERFWREQDMAGERPG